MLRYGPVWEIRVPLVGRILTSTVPEDIAHILAKNFANYPKAPYIKPLANLLFGGGIFGSSRARAECSSA